MAVILKMNGFEALKVLGVSDVDLEALKSKGCNAIVTIAAIKITLKDEVLSSVPVKATTLDYAKNNKLSASSKASLKTAVEGAVLMALTILSDSKSMLHDLVSPSTDITDMAETEAQLAAVVGSMSLSQGDHEEENDPSDEDEGVSVPSLPPTAETLADQFKGTAVQAFDLNKMETASRVQLTDATHLYQPVKATSENSRYFVVAIAPGLKIAARSKGGTLSIRVEGELLSVVMPHLEQIGFSKNGSYSSLHLSPHDPVLAAKTIGAVLAAVNVQFMSPIPLHSVLYGKGH